MTEKCHHSKNQSEEVYMKNSLKKKIENKFFIILFHKVYNIYSIIFYYILTFSYYIKSIEVD